MKSMPFISEFSLIILGGVLLTTLIREIIYRVFFIYPHTDFSGKYAAFIEDRHIYRWLVPTIADKSINIDVMFAGNSHVMDGIDPATINEETGLVAYNLALYSLPAQNAIDLLLQFQRYPRLIFIDFSTRYSTYHRSEYVRKSAEKAFAIGQKRKLLFELIDRVCWLMPSLFIPRPYRSILWRSFKKIRNYYRTGRLSIGRYTPFRFFISYQWKLDKTTNHRIARRVRDKSHWETDYENYLLSKTLRETLQYCNLSNIDYLRGLKQTEEMIETLLKHKVQVILMRMPLHPSLKDYENENFSEFFDDIVGMAKKFSLDFIDLNSTQHQSRIGELYFYSDGQHLIYPSDKRLSIYLSKIVIAKLCNRKKGIAS